MLFDTHAHLNDEKFVEDLPQVVERAVQAGVTRVGNIGFDVPS
ncbi:MAG: hydrolase TatD, partial [Clostridia bacterium]|nr:hydrolase TatD [Clostridia bacterium]